MNDGEKSILSEILKKKTLALISKELNIRQSTLQARVESLIHQGYLEQVTYGSSCAMCPMNCSSSTCQSPLTLFSLTEKGKRLLES